MRLRFPRYWLRPYRAPTHRPTDRNASRRTLGPFFVALVIAGILTTALLALSIALS